MPPSASPSDKYARRRKPAYSNAAQQQQQSLRNRILLVLLTSVFTWLLSAVVHSSGGIAAGDVFSSASSTSLIQTQHAQFDASIPSRIFPKFNYAFPCTRGEDALMSELPAADGILFQRPHKTGSTTMVGIVLRLAHNRARNLPFSKCKHRTMHGTARQYEYRNRNLSSSLLFSIIRDPTKRFISEFFHFDATAYQVEPTDINFIKSAQKKPLQSYYLKELTTRKTNAGTELEFAKSRGYDDVKSMIPHLTPDMKHDRNDFTTWGPNYNATTVVQQILDDYDFIATLERLDESLVIMQMLFGLTTKEILYTRARSGGGFSNGWKGRPCFYILKSFLTPGMKKYFSSDDWKRKSRDDLLMYKAANASIDRTIAALGRAQFDAKMVDFQHGLKMATENCRNRIKGMCDEAGAIIPVKMRSCYIWSEGCDHACIDELHL